MPELPEVETIVRYLRDGNPRDLSPEKTRQVREIASLPPQPSLLGKTIERVELLWGRTLAEPSEPEFYDRIIGQSIRDISRRAKYLIFHLDDYKLIVHLRMSGDLLVENKSDPVAPHHRLLLYFEDHLRLAFNDTRKFGRVWLVQDASSILGKLGPEPLAEDFTSKKLFTILKKRKRQLKPLLMDQAVIAGLGNIYTDEALHIAKLHPLTSADSLTEAQVEALWTAIRAVLLEGIRQNGASIDWVYRGGGFQNQFQVYGRKDEPCFQCGAPIHRIVVGQRGTHLCTQCQPEE